jgi:very-short-patch-repair endonuclease
MDAELLQTAVARLQAVVSHESAALVWGIELVAAPTTPHVTVERDRSRAKHDGVRVHRSDLATDDIAVVDGVQVTSVVRTLFDLCRCLPLDEAVVAIDSALRKGLAGPWELTEALCALPAARGRARVARAVALMDPRAGSMLESRCRVLMVLARLPEFRTQYTVRHAGRWIGRVDFAWPEYRLIVETDGFAFHSDRERYRSDRRRLNALQLAGWTVLRFSWEDVVHHPDYVLASISRSITELRAAA